VAKGPATAADLPPLAGPALLGEPSRRLPDSARRGYATVIAISAVVPATMRPEPAPAPPEPAPVDSAAPIADTVPSRPLGPEP
jgi:hypothetical protein